MYNKKEINKRIAKQDIIKIYMNRCNNELRIRKKTATTVRESVGMSYLIL